MRTRSLRAPVPFADEFRRQGTQRPERHGPGVPGRRCRWARLNRAVHGRRSPEKLSLSPIHPGDAWSPTPRRSIHLVKTSARRLDVGACQFNSIDDPEGWHKPDFDDSDWPSAVEYSESAVRQGRIRPDFRRSEAHADWATDLRDGLHHTAASHVERTWKRA